jgi:type VI secretion system protein ImpC
MRLGSIVEIPQLPAYTYRIDGEVVLQPCAESALLERAAEIAIASGVMPLQGFRNKNAVRLLSFQSLARTTLACRL